MTRHETFTTSEATPIVDPTGTTGAVHDLRAEAERDARAIGAMMRIGARLLYNSEPEEFDAGPEWRPTLSDVAAFMELAGRLADHVMETTSSIA